MRKMCEDHNCQYYIQLMYHVKHMPHKKALMADLARCQRKLREAREEIALMKGREGEGDVAAD